MPAAIPAAVAVGGAFLNSYLQKKDNASAQDAANSANARGSVPDYAMPFVQDGLQRAKDLSQTKYTPYTGQLVAGKNQYEQNAQNSISGWANGTPQSQQAAGIFSNMASNPNAFAQNAASAGYNGVSAVTSDYNKADANLAGMTNATTTNATTRDATAQGYNPSMATNTMADNPYLGQTSKGIAGVGSVAQGQRSNPYLGQSVAPIAGAPQVQAGRNAMLGMDNPYLRDQIDFASGDIKRNYNDVIAPQQDRRMAMSGSFGNTGLMSQENEQARNLAGELGRVSSGMRMQDYGQQQQLQEADVNRRLGADQFNANNQFQTQQFNAGLRGNDLSRNLGASFQQQGMGLDAAKFDAGNQLNTQQFNAGLGQSDLARNSGFAQQLGQFNASNANANSQYNASAANQAGQFGAAANNAASQNNANAYNQNSQFNAAAANNTSQYNTGQFNANALANAGILNQNSQYNANQGNDMARYNGTNMQNALNFNSSALNANNQFNTNSQNDMARWNGSMAASQQGQGLAGLLGLDQRGLQAGQALGVLGQQQRGIDQQGLTSAYEQWLRQQQAPQQQLDSYINSIRGLTFGSQPQTAQTQSVGGAALGGAAAGLGLYQGLFGNSNPFQAYGGGVANGAANSVMQAGSGLFSGGFGY